MATTYAVFERAERAERLAGAIYRAVADAFPKAPEAATFKRLADEEDQHAARVRLAAARYRHDPRLFENILFQVELLDALLETLERFREELAAGRWAQDYPGLLVRLEVLEEQGAAAHADVLASGGSAEVAAFFRQLAEQDRGHRDLLRRSREGR